MINVISITLALLLPATASYAKSETIDGHKIAGSGGTSRDGQYTIGITISQRNTGRSRAGGNYSLTGGFSALRNDLSAGDAYGDDTLTSSHYPLERVTDGYGYDYSLSSFNWSGNGVQSGNQLMSIVYFKFERREPGLAYSRLALANGISSDAAPFRLDDEPVCIEERATLPHS